MFDRHEILKKHYKEQINSWNWKAIKKDALSNCFYDKYECPDSIIASTYLGSILHIFPSGKYYMPWCTNQTRSDVTKDTAFNEALEEIAEANGMYITGSDGDGCDLLAQFTIDFSDYDTMKDQIQFITDEDYEAFEDRYLFVYKDIMSM